MKKKITIISQYFYPDCASTGKLMTDLALGLANKNCDVEVFTGYPSYWGIRQNTLKTENYCGILINRIFHIQSDTRTKSGSILIGFSFFIFLFQRLFLLSENRIFLYVTTPPFLPIIGYILKKIRNKKYVIIVHDIYPDIAIKINYLNEGLISKIWDYLNLQIYNNAERIIVLGECMADKLKQKYSHNSNKIKIIQNWEDPFFIKPLEKSMNPFSLKNSLIQSFVVIYSGNMGVNHNLKIIIKSANYLKNSEIKFFLFGEGSQKQDLINYSKELNLQSITFYNYQSRENLPITMTCGDAIIVSQEVGTEGLCVSSKFYTALAAGKPIIAIIGENSEIAKIVKTYRCGIVISDNNPKSVADALRMLSLDKSLCESLGKNARIVFEQKYTAEIAINKYYLMIDEIYNSN